MLVNIIFNEAEGDWDIADIPDVLADDIERIYQQFVEWVYDCQRNQQKSKNYKP